MKSKRSNPGSPRAIANGCKCPILDNANGKGYMGGFADKDGGPVFVMMENCPLHGMKLKQPEKPKKTAKPKPVCDVCDKGGQLGTCAREYSRKGLHHARCCIRRYSWVAKGKLPKRHRHRYKKVCLDCGKDATV